MGQDGDRATSQLVFVGCKGRQSLWRINELVTRAAQNVTLPPVQHSLGLILTTFSTIKPKWPNQ